MIIGCYFNLYVLPVSDSRAFHQLGAEEFDLLFSNPYEYFTNIFHDPYTHGYSRLFEDSQSFWNNLRTILVAKMVSLFDLFSFKNFWINSLFFNFLMFFGSAALYKVFVRLFPKAIIQLVFCIFLLPSALFFSSMIHRDGLILLSISMIIYHFHYIIKLKKIHLKNVIILFLFLLLVFLLRNFVFLALIPALTAWWIASRFPQKAFLIYAIIYTACLSFFFVSGFIHSKINFPALVAQRQTSFVEIGKQGNSTLDVRLLKPTIQSFIASAPQAFNLSLMRPYLSKMNQLQFAPFALEIFIMEILFILFLFFHKRDNPVPPLIYFNLFFSLSMLMLAGYTVPIIGAIVRYRSIYFIFLMIPITCYTDWEKIYDLISGNPKN